MESSARDTVGRKMVILAAFFVHVGAWVIAFNVEVSFSPDVPASIFGQRADHDLALDVALASLLTGLCSLFTLAIFIPFVLIDFGSVAKRVRSISTRKPKAGYCPVCRYNLTGNVSATCPECGTGVHVA